MSETYSEAELLKFMDWLGEKGLVNPVTAKSRRIASAKVLGALDDHEKLDLRDFDREQAFQRFMNKSSKDFTPGSLTTYKSRFYSALDDFLSWRANPAGFKPAGTQRVRTKTTDDNDQSSKTRKLQTVTTASKESNTSELGQGMPGQSLVFPIPIRDGVTVKIHNLPMDLSKTEADRICAVVKALAVIE
jgi:hypothetical protein